MPRRRRILLPRAGPPLVPALVPALVLMLACPVAGFLAAGPMRRRPELASAASAVSSGAVATGPEPPNVPYALAEDVPVWQVPSSIRKPGAEQEAPPAAAYVHFLGLAEIFPGPDGQRLADGFDANAAFRRAIRVAMRDDLFIPDPARSEKVNRFLKDLGSSLHVSWERSPTGYGNLTRVFQEHGIHGIDGRTFIKTLGGLAGGGAQVKDADGFLLRERRFGSLIDIVNPGNRLKPAHSWHQDCNLDQMTVMLGFPRANGYRGAGVFSHGVKLSHQLRDQVQGGGQVVQYDNYEGCGESDDLPLPLPESIIFRPWYQKGAEVMVYNDAWHIHSAPDHIHREATWRFM